MIATILSFALLAFLALIVVVAFYFGPRTLEPFYNDYGSVLIVFALCIYIASWIRLLFAAIQIPTLKTALQSRHRQTLMFSATILIAYILWASYLLIRLFLSTDL
jgi:hypothetical protein